MKKIEWTPLKIVAISVFGLLVFFSFLSNVLIMVAWGYGVMIAGQIFAMFGEFVMAFAIAFVIWLVSDIMEGKKTFSSAKKQVPMTAGSAPQPQQSQQQPNQPQA